MSPNALFNKEAQWITFLAALVVYCLQMDIYEVGRDEFLKWIIPAGMIAAILCFGMDPGVFIWLAFGVGIFVQPLAYVPRFVLYGYLLLVALPSWVMVATKFMARSAHLIPRYARWLVALLVVLDLREFNLRDWFWKDCLAVLAWQFLGYTLFAFLVYLGHAVEVMESAEAARKASSQVSETANAKDIASEDGPQIAEDPIDVWTLLLNNSDGVYGLACLLCPVLLGFVLRVLLAPMVPSESRSDPLGSLPWFSRSAQAHHRLQLSPVRKPEFVPEFMLKPRAPPKPRYKVQPVGGKPLEFKNCDTTVKPKTNPFSTGTSQYQPGQYREFEILSKKPAPERKLEKVEMTPKPRGPQPYIVQFPAFTRNTQARREVQGPLITKVVEPKPKVELALYNQPPPSVGPFPNCPEPEPVSQPEETPYIGHWHEKEGAADEDLDISMSDQPDLPLFICDGPGPAVTVDEKVRDDAMDDMEGVEECLIEDAAPEQALAVEIYTPPMDVVSEPFEHEDDTPMEVDSEPQEDECDMPLVDVDTRADFVNDATHERPGSQVVESSAPEVAMVEVPEPTAMVPHVPIVENAVESQVVIRSRRHRPILGIEPRNRAIAPMRRRRAKDPFLPPEDDVPTVTVKTPSLAQDVAPGPKFGRISTFESAVEAPAETPTRARGTQALVPAITEPSVPAVERWIPPTAPAVVMDQAATPGPVQGSGQMPSSTVPTFSYNAASTTPLAPPPADPSRFSVLPPLPEVPDIDSDDLSSLASEPEFESVWEREAVNSTVLPPTSNPVPESANECMTAEEELELEEQLERELLADLAGLDLARSPSPRPAEPPQGGFTFNVAGVPAATPGGQPAASEVVPSFDFSFSAPRPSNTATGTAGTFGTGFAFGAGAAPLDFGFGQQAAGAQGFSFGAAAGEKNSASDAVATSSAPGAKRPKLAMKSRQVKDSVPGADSEPADSAVTASVGDVVPRENGSLIPAVDEEEALFDEFAMAFNAAEEEEERRMAARDRHYDAPDPLSDDLPEDDDDFVNQMSAEDRAFSNMGAIPSHFMMTPDKK
ncbi:hypothetical protein LQW54_004698 [Pestalotiopsis sp. IQ-011]